MATRPEKEKRLKFYIINIKLRKRTTKEDLPAEEYVKLFRRLYKQKVHTESSPSKHCILKSIHEEKGSDGKANYVSGLLAQFTFIENNRWFDLEKLDLDEEFKVRDGLFPDPILTEYVFIPSAHRFCFRIQSGVSISPYPVKKFLEKALDQVSDADYIVHVDVETSTDTLREILQARIVKKLVIDLNYSNFDIGDDVKKFVDDDIRQSNANRFQIIATQKPHTSIDINDSKILKGGIENALSNGEATATIIDSEGKLQTVKTSAHPRIEDLHGFASRFNDLVFEKIIRIFRPRK